MSACDLDDIKELWAWPTEYSEGIHKRTGSRAQPWSYRGMKAQRPKTMGLLGKSKELKLRVQGVLQYVLYTYQVSKSVY